MISKQLTVIIFVVDNKLLGINSVDVIEVLPMLQMTKTFDKKNNFHTVFNLRGEIIPAIKLREKLGCAEMPDQIWNKILIIERKGQRYGLVVDDVKDVVNIDSDHPKTRTNHSQLKNSEIFQWGPSLVTMLELNKIITDEKAVVDMEVL